MPTAIPVHRSIICVDVQGFGDQRRTNLHQVSLRRGLYRALETAFARSGVPWGECYHEDRGDGVLILVPPSVAKNLLVTKFSEGLGAALSAHNQSCDDHCRIRLRAAIHAGEVLFDDHGVAGGSINLASRLVDSDVVKRALADSTATLILIASQWFYDEVIRHEPTSSPESYRRVHVVAKETVANAWIRLPDKASASGDVEGADADRPRRVASHRQLPRAPEPWPTYRSTLGAPIRTLPRDIAAFTGRHAELRQLVAAADAARIATTICTVDGMAGVGKTALVTHAAHMLASSFPDGQMFVDLHAHTPGQRPADPADVLADLLTCTGMSLREIPADLETRAQRWRDRLAGKKVLLILDDVVGRSQVEPLLPGVAGCLVLVTSRRRLIALDGAEPLPLETLPPDDARDLFTRLAHRTPSRDEKEAVAELVRLCGYLPLAIALLAGRLAHHPNWPIATFAAGFATAQDRLAQLAVGDRAVTAAFELSHQDLPDGQPRVFRHLGLHPGSDIGVYAAAALGDIPPAQAEAYLDSLYTDHLIDEPAPGRYRLHDLIRLYTRTLVLRHDSQRDSEQALNRLLDYYQHTAQAASRQLARHRRPEPPSLATSAPAAVPRFTTWADAITWMRAERANLLGCIAHAAAHGHPMRVVALTAAMAAFLRQDGPWQQAAELHQAAAAIARQNRDQLSEANALHDLAIVHSMAGKNPATIDLLGQALDIYQDIGSPLGAANALQELGREHRLIANYSAASRTLEQALRTYQDIGDLLGEANTLRELGRTAYMSGDSAAAADLLQQALAIYHGIDDQIGEANALRGLGHARRLAGDYPAAADLLGQALAIYRDIGDRLGEANALRGRGAVLRMMGNYPAATDALRQALSLFSDIGGRLGEANTLHELGNVKAQGGHYSTAVDLLTRALVIYGDIGDQNAEAEARKDIARLSAGFAEPHED